MVGADIFYGGSEENRRIVEESGELGETLFPMVEGLLPFPDSHFDFVCSNQVFEHVKDVDLALAEIRRTLKPSGVFLNIVPGAHVVREGHCGIAFAHRLNRFPHIQTVWLLFWRLLGFGYQKSGVSPYEWAHSFSDYLRRYTHYQSRSQINAAYARHFESVDHVEHGLACFRLSQGGRAKLALLAEARGLRRFTNFAISRLGAMVIVAKAPLPR